MITQATVDGDDIADEVRWGMAQVLMIAGHETTVNATANLVHHLATRPALRHQVATDHVMRAKVITESLRFESPVFGLARTVVEDTQLGRGGPPQGRPAFGLFRGRQPRPGEVLRPGYL